MEMRDPSANEQNAAEQTLKQTPAGAMTDENKFEQVVENGVALDPEEAAEDEMTEGITSNLQSKDAILDALKALAEKDPADISGDEVRRLRQHYNAIHKNEEQQAREQWVADGNAEDAFTYVADEADTMIPALIEQLRLAKAEYAAKQEAEKEANLKRKNEIIAEILSLADDTDNVNHTLAHYRELQDEFNALGAVPATEETAIWKRFQEARERYSDNLKINIELRDYDFKKNLDSKQHLLNEAEGLINEDDVITAYRRLQELHNKWRQIGPVAKELREEIWDKFKTASAEINKRYQAHFEARKEREAANEAAKTEICQRLEALDFSGLKSFADWDNMTKLIIEAQEEWKKLGYASRKMNNQIFARFRQICDNFFAAKSEFFKNTREELSRNLAAKTALAERAEALKDSTDWRKATDEFVAMQKEWKTIGTVAKKHSDAVWQRFLAACDYFFEQKKKATSDVRHTETANLKAKKDIIARLDQITEDTPHEEAIATLRKLQDEWKQIGHVPFKEKDKVYDAYREKVDNLRRRFNTRENRASMDRFENAIEQAGNDENKLYRERERLLRTAEVKRNELRTYENNLGFLKSSSKSGDSLLRDFQQKIERIKADLQTIDEKVRLIDSKL